MKTFIIVLSCISWILTSTVNKSFTAKFSWLLSKNPLSIHSWMSMTHYWKVYADLLCFTREHFPQVEEIGIERVRTYKDFYRSVNLKSHLKPELFILFSTEPLEPQPTSLRLWRGVPAGGKSWALRCPITFWNWTASAYLLWTSDILVRFYLSKGYFFVNVF